MNPHEMQRVCRLAEYFGLAVEYVDDLPHNAPGCLDPYEEPRYIAINRRLPEFEQVFTIAHELGHFVHHRGKSPRRFFPRLLDRQWKSQKLTRAGSTLQRFLQRRYNREWQADLWALCVLCSVGAKDTLTAYLEAHPEKSWLVLLTAAVRLVKLPLQIIKAILRKLFIPGTKVA